MSYTNWTYVDTTGLPPAVSLITEDVPIANQGNIGSCTANASVEPIELLEFVCNKNTVSLSRLFQYYNSRSYMPNEIGVDNGAQPPDMMAALAQYGVCLETTWPYDTAQVETKPTDAAYVEGLNYVVTGYSALNPNLGSYYKGTTQANWMQLKALLAMGYPVMFSSTVMGAYQNICGTFEAQQAQYVNYGASGELGVHEQVIMGYDDVNEWVLVRNSWGDGWGFQGYTALPYSIFFSTVSSLYFITNYKNLKFPSQWNPPMPTPTPTPLAIIGCTIDTTKEPLLTIVTNQGTNTFTNVDVGLSASPNFCADLLTFLNAMLK